MEPPAGILLATNEENSKPMEGGTTAIEQKNDKKSYANSLTDPSLSKGLPYHMHSWHYIKQIVGTIRTPLCMVAAISSKTRPSMVKVRVELDLLKSHPDYVWINLEDENTPLKGGKNQNATRMAMEQYEKKYEQGSKVGNPTQDTTSSKGKDKSNGIGVAKGIVAQPMPEVTKEYNQTNGMNDIQDKQRSNKTTKDTNN
ncbi:hypothetical protein HAX54_020631 [Datura stramonium]|uniref:Uncharacterized protein n=1 Tax=Datura stramonium TaxID=4076 RepID=A0ABS8UT28_DATST|nr:hypothetical protein [Datura stramonium]